MLSVLSKRFEVKAEQKSVCHSLKGIKSLHKRNMIHEMNFDSTILRYIEDMYTILEN